MTTPHPDNTHRPVLQRETSRRREVLWKGATASSLGIEMGVAVVIGLLIGRWLDGRFDTDPLWTLVFLCVGIAAGFRGLVRVARQHQRDLAVQASSPSVEPSAATAPEPAPAGRPANDSRTSF